MVTVENPTTGKDDFHRRRAWQIVLNFNTVYHIYIIVTGKTMCQLIDPTEWVNGAHESTRIDILLRIFHGTYIDGVVQNCSISSALAMGILHLRFKKFSLSKEQAL